MTVSSNSISSAACSSSATWAACSKTLPGRTGRPRKHTSPGARRAHADREPGERALAGAVGADHGHPFALGDGQGHVVHRAVGAEVDADVIPGQHRTGAAAGAADRAVPAPFPALPLGSRQPRALARLRQRGNQPASPGPGQRASSTDSGERAGEGVGQRVREPDHVGHADADACPAGLVGPGHPGRLIEHDAAAVHQHDAVGPRARPRPPGAR